MMKPPAVVLFVAVCGGAAALFAEEQADKREKKSVRVYTDDDLKKARSAPANVTVLSGTPPSPAPGEGNEAPEPAAEEAPAEKKLSPEEEWRARAAARRKAIAGAEERIRDLQAEIDALALDTDPTAADVLDPNRLQKREARKAEAIEQLRATREQLATAQRALEELEKEAAEKHIPPGWLREP